MKLSCALVFTLTNLVIATPFSFSVAGSGASAKDGAAAVPFGTFGVQPVRSNPGKYSSTFSKPSSLSFTSSRAGSNLSTLSYNGAQADVTTPGQAGSQTVLTSSQRNKNSVTSFSDTNAFSASGGSSGNTETTELYKHPFGSSNAFHVDVNGGSKLQSPHQTVTPVKKPSSFYGEGSPVSESHEISKSNEENVITSSRVPNFSNQHIVSGSVYPTSNTYSSFSNGAQTDSSVTITASEDRPTVGQKPIYNGGFGGPPGILTPFDKGSSFGSNQANNNFQAHKQVEQLSAPAQSKPQGFNYTPVTSTQPSHVYINKGSADAIKPAGQTFNSGNIASSGRPSSEIKLNQSQISALQSNSDYVFSPNNDIGYATHAAFQFAEKLKPQSGIVGNTFASSPVRPGQYDTPKPNAEFGVTGSKFDESKPVEKDQYYVHEYPGNVPFSSNDYNKQGTQAAPESPEKFKPQSAFVGNTFASTPVLPGQYHTQKPNSEFGVTGSKFDESKPAEKDQYYVHEYPGNVPFSSLNEDDKQGIQTAPGSPEKFKPQSVFGSKTFASTPVTPGSYDTPKPNSGFAVTGSKFDDSKPVEKDQYYVHEYPGNVPFSSNDYNKQGAQAAPESPEKFKPQSAIVGNTFASTPVLPGQYHTQKPNSEFGVTGSKFDESKPAEKDQYYVHEYPGNVPFSSLNEDDKQGIQTAPGSPEKFKPRSVFGSNTFTSTSDTPAQYDTPKQNAGFAVTSSRFDESKPITKDQVHVHVYPGNVPFSSSNSDVKPGSHAAPESPEKFKTQSIINGNSFVSTPTRPGQYVTPKPHAEFSVTKPNKNDQVYVHVYSGNAPFSSPNGNDKQGSQAAPESPEKFKPQSVFGSKTFASTPVTPGSYDTPKQNAGFAVTSSRFDESKPITKDQVHVHVYPGNVPFSSSNSDVKPGSHAAPESPEKFKTQSIINGNSFVSTPTRPGQYVTPKPHAEFSVTKPNKNDQVYVHVYSGNAPFSSPNGNDKQGSQAAPESPEKFKPQSVFGSKTFASTPVTPGSYDTPKPNSGFAVTGSKFDDSKPVEKDQYYVHEYPGNVPFSSNDYNKQGAQAAPESPEKFKPQSAIVGNTFASTPVTPGQYGTPKPNAGFTVTGSKFDESKPIEKDQYYLHEYPGNVLFSSHNDSYKQSSELPVQQALEYTSLKPNSYYPDGSRNPSSSSSHSSQVSSSLDKTKQTNQFPSISQYKPSFTDDFEGQSGVVNPSSRPIKTGISVSSNTYPTYKPFVTASPFDTSKSINDAYAGLTSTSSSATDSISKLSDSPNTPATSKNPSYAVSAEVQESSGESSSNAYTSSVDSVFNYNSFSGKPQLQLSTKPIAESIPQRKPAYSNTFGTLTGAVKPSSYSYTSVTNFPSSTSSFEYSSSFVSGSDKPKQTSQFTSTSQSKPTFIGSFGGQTEVLNPTSQAFPTGSTSISSNTLSPYKPFIPLNITKQSSRPNQNESQFNSNFELHAAFPKPYSSGSTGQYSGNNVVASTGSVTPRPTASDNHLSQTYTDTISGTTFSSFPQQSSEGSKASVIISGYSEKEKNTNTEDSNTQKNIPVVISSVEQKPVSQTFSGVGSQFTSSSAQTQFSLPLTEKKPWYSNTYKSFTTVKPLSHSYPGFSSSFNNFGHSSSTVAGSLDKTKQSNQYTSTGQNKPSYNWGFVGQSGTLKPSNQLTPTGSTFVSPYTSTTFKPFVTATLFDKLKPDSGVTVTGQKESSFAFSSSQSIIGETAYQNSNTEATSATFVTHKPTVSHSSVSQISNNPISGSPFSGNLNTPKVTTTVIPTTPKYEIQKPFGHKGQIFSNEGSSLGHQSYFSTTKPTTELSLEKLEENSEESKPSSQSHESNAEPESSYITKPVNKITPIAQNKPSYTNVYGESWNVKPSSQPILSHNAVVKPHEPTFDSTSYNSFNKDTHPSPFTTIKPTSFVSSIVQTVSGISSSTGNSHFDSSQHNFNKHVDSNIPSSEHSEQQTDKPATEITLTNGFTPGYSEAHPTEVASAQKKLTFSFGYEVSPEVQTPSSQSFLNSAVYQTNKDFSSSSKPGTPSKLGGPSGVLKPQKQTSVSYVSYSSSAGFENNSDSVSVTIDKSNSNTEYKPHAIVSSHISSDRPASYKPFTKPSHFDTSKPNSEVTTELSTSTSSKVDESKVYTTGSVSGSYDTQNVTPVVQANSYPLGTGTTFESSKPQSQHLSGNGAFYSSRPHIKITVIGHPSSTTSQPPYAGGFGGPAGILKPNDFSVPHHINAPVTNYDQAISTTHYGTNTQFGSAASYHGGFGGSSGVLKPNENEKPFFSNVHSQGEPHLSHNLAPNAPFTEAQTNYKEQRVVGAQSTANAQVRPTATASSSGFIDSNVHNSHSIQNLGNPLNYGASSSIVLPKNSNTHNGQIGELYGFGLAASEKSSTGTSRASFGIGKSFASDSTSARPLFAKFANGKR